MDKEWRDESRDVRDLNLDLQNPRLPKKIREQKDLSTVRQYLFEHEGVMEIARSIAKNGYHKSAVSIAYEEEGKLVVLDGNRRLAACQLLLDPSLVNKAPDREKLKELDKTLNKSELSHIKITIAPSRKAAEREIWDIHVNRLLKSWEQLQRLRMYKNLIDDREFNVETAANEYGTTKGEFANELAKLHFYEWILEIGGNTAEERMREAGFNAIERLILSRNGKRLLKYSVSNEGIVTFEDTEEAKHKLRKLIPYIIGSKKVPAQASQKYLEENVYAKIDPKGFSKKEETKKQDRKKKQKKIQPSRDDVTSLNLKRRRNSVKYNLSEAVDIVEHILVHFDAVAEQLQSRHDNRETLSIGDEYDVQDLLHALLSLFFDDVAGEEWAPSGGGSSSRMDFLLLDNGTVIEVKTTLTRKGDAKKIRTNLEKELNDDLIKYSRYPNCKRIYFFVYDPERKVKKHTTFERAVASSKLQGIDIKAIVNRG
jgi:ParB-like chromosome segregation protein Spo0J